MVDVAVDEIDLEVVIVNIEKEVVIGIMNILERDHEAVKGSTEIVLLVRNRKL